MWYSVDRFEGSLVVLMDDEENCITVERTRLPDDIRQGDVLRYADDCYILDAEETAKRREEIRQLEQRLRNK